MYKMDRKVKTITRVSCKTKIYLLEHIAWYSSTRIYCGLQKYESNLQRS